MRMTQAVRIGGWLALVVGCATLNPIVAGTLTYYYGYSSSLLMPWRVGDGYGSQNVSFVQWAPLVVVATNSLPSYDAGMTSAASSFSTFNDVASLYGFRSPVSTIPAPNHPDVIAAVPSSNVSQYATQSYPVESYAFPAPSVNASNFSTLSTTFNPNPPAPVMSASTPLPYVNTAPAITENFTAPTAAAPPVVNLPRSRLIAPLLIDTPEPATIVLVAAGFAALLVLRRRTSA
jgi:hypothetical protein